MLHASKVIGRSRDAIMYQRLHLSGNRVLCLPYRFLLVRPSLQMLSKFHVCANHSHSLAHHSYDYFQVAAC